MDPLSSPAEWVLGLLDTFAHFSEGYFWDLSRRERIAPAEVEATVQACGVVRVSGIGQNLDVFRIPNNLEAHDFEAAWENAPRLPDERFRVLSEIDLVVTKLDTARQRDHDDIAFLEGKIRRELEPLLAACDSAEAQRIFSRYADHETCRAALANPNSEVRALAIRTLREFADAGNPFARETLAQLEGNAG